MHFLALRHTVAVILHAGISCCFRRMILKSTVFLLNFIITLELYGSDAYTTGLVKTRTRPYVFGVDPVWHGSATELTFLNSLKMKMSILIGVAQMNLGIILSYFNATFFKNDLNIW